MTQMELSNLRNILEGQRAVLAGSLHHREDITGARSADQLDQIQNALERDMAIGNLERDSSRLREVCEALDRLQTGTFGFCSECDEAISARRLAAVPWTTHCLSCMEAADGLKPRFGFAPEMNFRQAA